MIDQPTLDRLALLERHSRRLRLCCIALAIVVLGLAAAIVEAFREQSDFERYGLRTTRVVVSSERGAYSALGSLKEQPYFKLVDADDTFRLFCSLEQAGPALMLADSEGRPRLRLAVDDQGGSIKLLNADGSTRWTTP